MQYAVVCQDVRVFDGENVRRSVPLGQRERERRRIAGFTPRSGDGTGALEMLHGNRVHHGEHIEVGALLDLVAAGRRAVEHD